VRVGDDATRIIASRVRAGVARPRAIVMNCQRMPPRAGLCYDRPMMGILLGLTVAAWWAAADGDAAAASRSAASEHFAVSAQFRPGKAAGTGEVAVTFAPRDPDVHVNATPAPRLKLDTAQKILADKPGPRPAAGPPDEKYLDLTFPVVFPVAVVAAPRAPQSVKGSLTYYYCSERQGWCRKGTALVEIPVKGH